MGRGLQGVIRRASALALAACVVGTVAVARPPSAGSAVQTAVRHTAPAIALGEPSGVPIGRRWG